MRAILTITLLELLLDTVAFGFHGNILSDEFVTFHNSRTDVTWKVMYKGFHCMYFLCDHN